MATFDLAAADNALKIWFQDPITDQVIARSDLLDWFEQNSMVKESDFGRYVEVSDIYGDPEGVGARGEKEPIPQAQDPLFQRAQIYLKYIYGTVEMTKQVMQQMQRGPAAFISWADAEMKRLERAVRQDMDRQLFGFGAGIIARVNDATPQATALAVDNSYGVTNLARAAERFRVGARYRFFAGADATTPHTATNTSAKVTSIDRAGGTVTFDAIPTDTADNDYIMRGDDVGHSGQDSAGADKEVMGLLGMVDDGNILASYFGVTRSTYSPYQGQITNVGGNLTELALITAVDDAIDYGGGDPRVAITTRGVIRNFYAQLNSQISFNDPRAIRAGHRGLIIQAGDREILLRASRQAPAGILFMLTQDTLQRLHNTGWEWADETGSIFKQVTSSGNPLDAFYAYGRWFIQTFNKSPQANTRLDAITES